MQVGEMDRRRSDPRSVEVQRRKAVTLLVARRYTHVWFILPGFLLYTALIVYPIFQAILTSLTVWSGVGEKTFVGIANYVELLTDQKLTGQMLNALGNNLTIFLLNVFVVTPVQVLWAYGIYRKAEGYKIFQLTIYAPQFISTPVIGFLSILLLDANVGLFNQFLFWVGLPDAVRPWIGVPEYGLFIVWAVMAWAGIGVGMLFFLSAMKMIPTETIESAEIEGAGYFTILRMVVLPMIRATTANLIILTYIFSMTAFDLNFLFGGSTGGIHGQMDTMTLFFYRIAFVSQSYMGGGDSSNALGMGSTVSVVLFGMIFFAALLQLSLWSKREDL